MLFKQNSLPSKKNQKNNKKMSSEVLASIHSNSKRPLDYVDDLYVIAADVLSCADPDDSIRRAAIADLANHFCDRALHVWSRPENAKDGKSLSRFLYLTWESIVTLLGDAKSEIAVHIMLDTVLSFFDHILGALDGTRLIDVNVRSDEGYGPTLLYLLCGGDLREKFGGRSLRRQFIRLLLSRGADPNLPGRAEQRDTPISGCMANLRFLEQDDIENIRLLVQYGADVDFFVSGMKTALQTAAETGNFELCDVLVELGADVHKLDDRGRNIVHYIAMCHTDRGNRSEYLSFLRCLILHQKVQVHLIDEDGNTALSYAVISGFYSACKFLLEHGAHPDAGWVLHRAARGGHLHIVKLLLAHNADPNIIANGDRLEKELLNAMAIRFQQLEVTALDIAERYRHVLIAHILRRNGGQRFITENNGTDGSVPSQQPYSDKKYPAERSMRLLWELKRWAWQCNPDNCADMPTGHQTLIRGEFEETSTARTDTPRITDINEQDDIFGTTLPMFAFLRDDYALAERLVGEHFEDIRFDLRMHGGITLLHLAARMYSVDLCQKLVAGNHIPVNVRDEFDVSPLAYLLAKEESGNGRKILNRMEYRSLPKEICLLLVRSNKTERLCSESYRLLQEPTTRGVVSRISALVVGVSYKGSLPNAELDAASVKSSLEKFSVDEITFALNVDQQEFLRIVSEYSRRRGEWAAQHGDGIIPTVSLFYFAGHGLGYCGTNFLVPEDFVPQPELIPSTCVSLQSLVREIKSAGGRLGADLFLFDCCRESVFRAYGVQRLEASSSSTLRGLIGFDQEEPNVEPPPQRAAPMNPFNLLRRAGMQMIWNSPLTFMHQCLQFMTRASGRLISRMAAFFWGATTPTIHAGYPEPTIGTIYDKRAKHNGPIQGAYEVVYAAAPGGFADDGVAGENSPFCKALLEALSRRQVNMSQISFKIRECVHNLTEGRQQPCSSIYREIDILLVNR